MKAIKLFEHPSPDDGNPEGYDLYMGIWELSVSLGNFNHNVEESLKFIAENNTTLKNTFELVLLNDFRMKFELLQKGTDSDEQTIHETRGDLFMSLYKELLDIEKDETRRCGYLNLCYELFDSVHPKLNGRKKSFTYRVELIDRLHAQVQKILNRLNGTPVLDDTDENDNLRKNDLCSEEKGPSEEKMMSELRQTVSDIKLNFLKKVDKTLDLTLQNPSEVRSRKASFEKNERNESKNYRRNSKFTNELRLHSPRKIIDISEECYLVDDMKNNVREKLNDIIAGKDDQEILSPILKEISETSNSVEQSILKKLDTSSTQLSAKNHTFEHSSNKERNTKDLDLDNKDLKTSSHSNCKDISEECLDLNYNLHLGQTNEAVDEQDNQEMLSPILSQITQTVSDVKLNILKEVDKSLSELTLKSFSAFLQSEETIKNKSNSPVLNEACSKLSLTKKNDIMFDVRQKRENDKTVSDFTLQNTSEERIKNMSKTPVLNEACRRLSLTKESNIIFEISEESNFGKNQEKEKDTTVSELTLKRTSNASTSLWRNPSEENIKNKSKNPSLNEACKKISSTKESDISFEISEESDVGKNQEKEKDTTVSEVTLKCTSDVLLRKRTDEKFKKMSVNSEFSQNSGGSNAIMDLCKECDIKVNYSKELDKYIAEGLSIRKRNCNEVVRHNGSGDLNVSLVKNNVQKSRKSLPTWQHQRHIIAAPRAIIKNFKSNSSYEWSPHDPNAPDFYEQLDQFFEITGQRKCGSAFDICVSSIQSRLCQILKRLPREERYSDWMATVGKCNLEQLLTRNERNSYETLRWQSRDTGDQDLSAGSRFTDALHGMMGYESPHLKVSAITGRLQMRSPQHQDSISESYLLLMLGHLGYFYRELKEHLGILGQRGETAAALRKSLQKYLLNFYQFYEMQTKNPCSLLCLYRQTRGFQLQFQWLLDVLHNIQNEESIIVSLYEESGLRFGCQRSLLLKWLSVASQPLINRLQQWLLSGHLNSSDSSDELFIERSLASNTNDFWQKRYRITEHFSILFDPQLIETLISVGKTLKYSQKYLGIKVETCLSGKELRNILQETFEHFYLYGEQEPLYVFLRNLHSEVSGEVLKQLREMQPKPEYLFAQLHKYIMLTDVKFIRDFIDTFEAILGEPESFFNIRLFNEMKDQRLCKPIQDLYIDKGIGEGTRCWSRLVLRWKLPNHWIALLGEDAEEYEAISTALWRFRYVDYVLCERIFRQRTEILNRIDFKYFGGLEETFNCFGKLINMCLDLMKVLRQYFFKNLLEPAFARLLLACYNASTLDDIVEANRIYLKSIKLGCMQTNNLRKSNQYLDRLYNFILRLDDKQHKFFKLCKTSIDYVLEVRLKSSHNVLSNYYRNRMLNFRWTCENYTDVINELRDQFIMAMISFLFSLHLSDEDSLRSLALSLDPKGYYIRKDNKLRLVQSFEFKRKTAKSSLVKSI
nr:uncharacterized protein LOC108061206 [Drosophila takahashii]